MTPNDRILALIRTYVPYSIGALIAWVFAATQLDLSGEFQTAVIAFAMVVAQNAYYLIIRIVEARYPVLGIALGFPRQPQYADVSNLWASFLRTAIPTFVGVVLFMFANLGLKLDADAQTGAVVILVAVAQAIYYSLASAIVARYAALSWLLGPDVTPSYQAVAK